MHIFTDEQHRRTLLDFLPPDVPVLSLILHKDEQAKEQLPGKKHERRRRAEQRRSKVGAARKGGEGESGEGEGESGEGEG